MDIDIVGLLFTGIMQGILHGIYLTWDILKENPWISIFFLIPVIKRFT